MDKFSPKHYVFLLLATGIVSMKTYPIVFIQPAGRDSWVAVIGASILIFLAFLFMIKTLKSRPNTTLLNVYQTAVGKTFGTILIGIFMLVMLLTMVESACIEADSMHQNMMVETPSWYFLLFFTIPALYVIRKDTVAVIIITIIGIVLIMIAGIHLGILTTQQKNIMFLFPVFEKGLTGGFFTSMFKALGAYGFIGITLPYLSSVTEKRESLSKYTIIGLLIIIQMQIVSITGIFMTFSPADAESYYYPKLLQTHLVSYFEMLEFGELYVMLQILGGWLLKYVVTFHALIEILKSFDVKKHIIYILTFIITGVVTILSFLATYTSIRLFNLLYYFPWISLANFVVIPLIIFSIYRIKIKSAA